MTTLSEAIKAARIKRNLSQAELAKKAGVTQGTIGHLETGRSNATTKLPAIAKALGTTTEELLAGVSPGEQFFAMSRDRRNNLVAYDDPEDLPKESNRVWMPVTNYFEDQEAGKVLFYAHDKDALAFDADFFTEIDTPPDLCTLIRMSGSSMEPFLFHGDLVLIDRRRASGPVVSGLVYAVLFEGEPMIRQLSREPGGALTLRALNDRYQPTITVPPEHLDRFHAVGLVVFRSGTTFVMW